MIFKRVSKGLSKMALRSGVSSCSQGIGLVWIDVVAEEIFARGNTTKAWDIITGRSKHRRKKCRAENNKCESDETSNTTSVEHDEHHIGF